MPIGENKEFPVKVRKFLLKSYRCANSSHGVIMIKIIIGGNNDSFVVIHKTREPESVKVKRYPDQKAVFDENEVPLDGLILTEYYTDGTSEDIAYGSYDSEGRRIYWKDGSRSCLYQFCSENCNCQFKGHDKSKTKGKNSDCSKIREKNI